MQRGVGTAAIFIWGGIKTAIGFIALPISGGLSVGLIVSGLKSIGWGVVKGVALGFVASYITKQFMPTDFYLPLYRISPEEIFANEILLFDVNFFNPKTEKTETLSTGQQITQESSAGILQATISQWYFTIRNFAIVALLSILAYIGIRIVISSSAQDKAKYKQRLLDWLVAMCLLFFLHYIMAFAVTITELITKSLNKVTPQYIAVFDEETLKGYRWDFNQVVYKNYYNDKEISEEDIEKKGLSEDDIEQRKESTTIHSKIFKDEKDGIYEMFEKANIISEENGTKYLIWPTNLMGKARIDAQMEVDGEEGDNTLISQFGNTMIFLALVIYTTLFVFRYLKRLLMLAFLTIIAPFVAMTYPLDKMNDGSAQAFNTWLKEYIYNLLIQPVHLILYAILIGSAFEFAANNQLYGLVALGFMLQAEKIMRKFFGFEKASTLAGGSALGGALAMQGINMLRNVGKKGKKGGNGGKESGGQNSKVRYADRKADKGKKLNDLLDKPKNPTQEASPKPEGLGPETRGIGQWLKEEKWNGSTLQNKWQDAKTGVGNFANNMVAEPRRFVRNDKARSIRTKADNLARRRLGGAYQPLKNTAKRTIKGAKTMAKGIGGVAGAGIKYAAPRAAKLAAKGTLAGAAAMTGIAAGLVSDDFSNVAKWGATGAGTGWVAGGGIASKAMDMPEKAEEVIDNGIEAIESNYTLAAHGYEAEEQRKKDKSDMMAMHDKERRKLYANKLGLSGKKQIDDAMEDMKKFRESGITDDDLIIKAMNSKKFKSDRASDERIIAAGLADEAKKEQGTREEKLKVVTDKMLQHNLSQKDIETYSEVIKEINNW